MRERKINRERVVSEREIERKREREGGIRIKEDTNVMLGELIA